MRIHTSQKIKTLKALMSLVRHAKQRGKKIVAMSGSMDLLHTAHVDALERAKSYGDILVVLVNSDVSVRLYKGPNRPILSESERMRMVAALACVDYVCMFDAINPKQMLGVLKPDVYCVGSEWGKHCVERPVIESYGGVVRVIPRGAVATSDVIQRVQRSIDTPDVRAVFLDRDGTINDNKNGYVHTQEEFVFLPGVVTALKRLAKTPYKLFVVTNQSGVGRGYYDEHTVQKLHIWLKGELLSKGIHIENIYYCPHHPDDGCTCRKPGWGMIKRAVDEYGVNLSKSWIIGDSESDIGAGREANVQTIYIQKDSAPMKGVVRPQYVVKNMREAVEVIMGNKKN